MAGRGGIKGGMAYGKTDEFGHRAVENVVTPNDFQATIMHLFGLQHDQVLFPHNSQLQMITARRSARVVTDILA